MRGRENNPWIIHESRLLQMRAEAVSSLLAKTQPTRHNGLGGTETASSWAVN